MSIRVEFNRVSKENPKQQIWLHPVIGVLFSVLQYADKNADYDLGTINRHNPVKNKFKFYRRDDPNWDDDISHLVPTTDRWWETLGTL